MTMRVVGGVAKGHTLRATRARDMRPTTDTARRTIFDILSDRVIDARVLDLYAGAGTLGIEALSRGATFATFVERDRSACDVIERNLDETKLRARGTVVRSEVDRFLERAPDDPFDLVFLDPPYAGSLRFLPRVLRALLDGAWVGHGGTVVVEAEVGDLEVPAGLYEIRTRRFGRTQVRIAEVT